MRCQGLCSPNVRRFLSRRPAPKASVAPKQPMIRLHYQTASLECWPFAPIDEGAPMNYPFALLSIFSLISLIVFSVLFYRYLRTRRLEKRLRAMPFPESWRGCLERTVHYGTLSDKVRERIERDVLRFVHTKRFAGVGTEVTDEMRAVIAFYACLMVSNRPGYDFPSVDTVIVYADGFIANEHHEHGGIVTEGPAVLDGQSSRDTVVLSWPDVQAEAYTHTDANVVIHEFAHILDFEDGLSDGLPPMGKAAATEWEHHFSHVFTQLNHALEHGYLSQKYHFIGSYAATDEAEFFAVLSERYFMQPETLQHHFPELFRLLDAFYG